MKLEDIIEARLGGRNPDVTGDYAEAFRTALRAHEALAWAVGETIAFAGEDRQPPQLPDGYEIVRELGRGGMGVVYLAQQASLKRAVAVKVLRCGQVEQSRLVKRFLDEARHLAQLRHPNIVAIHEVGQSGDEPYFTMDFVAGESLASLLTRGPLSPAHALAILKQVAEGVQHAHEHGIVHRDLKPGNVLLDATGRAFVTDFGLARDVTAQSDLTRSGELLGTPSYMAPEQARGETAQIGEATDVHALGVLLYEMLTGKPPYGADSPAAVFARLLKDDPVSPRQLDRRIHRDLETICLKAMAKEPARRYSSVRAMVEDLRRFESGLPIAARRPGLLDRAARLARKHWKMAAAVLLTAGLAVALTIALTDKSVNELRNWGKEREQAGDDAGAIDVYRRAWKQAKEEKERAAIDADLIRCARRTDDPKVAVAVAMEILPRNPDVSFGKHDFIVAQAVITELRARHPDRSISNIKKEEDPLVEIASRRLKLFLDSSAGSPEQRQEAENSLEAITYALTGKKPQPSSPSTDEIPKEALPQGTLEELRQAAADTRRTAWDRSVARFQYARKLAEEASNQEALPEAEMAFEQLRKLYPIYRGSAASVVISSTDENRIGEEAPEGRILREADALIKRLNPKHVSKLRGGLRFRIHASDWPADVMADLHVKLTDIKTKDDPSFRTTRRVPFQKLQTEIGVADGTYRLECAEAGKAYHTVEGTRYARFTELDASEVPATVTIDGNSLEIPLRVRKLKELRMLAPAAGASFDPMNDFLRWEAVPGAAAYQVSISTQSERADARSMTYILGEKTTATQLCLGNLNDAFAIEQSRKLKAGMTCRWSVTAFDKAGRKLAITEEDSRPLLLTRDITR